MSQVSQHFQAYRACKVKWSITRKDFLWEIAAGLFFFNLQQPSPWKKKRSELFRLNVQAYMSVGTIPSNVVKKYDSLPPFSSIYDPLLWPDGRGGHDRRKVWCLGVYLKKK